MPTKPIRPLVGVNVPGLSLADFQVTLIGRFWMIPEAKQCQKLAIFFPLYMLEQIHSESVESEVLTLRKPSSIMAPEMQLPAGEFARTSPVRAERLVMAIYRTSMLVITFALTLLTACGSAWADGVTASEGFEGPTLPLGWVVSQGQTPLFPIGLIAGVSGPVLGLSPTQGNQFGWISNGPVVGTFSTSLLSLLFTIGQNSTLSMDLNFLSNDGGNFNDSAFVQLLSNGTPVANLYIAQDPSQGGPVVGQGFPSITPGVTLSPNGVGFLGNTVGPLGGDFFGPICNFNVCEGVGFARGSTGWVTSSYNPGAGTYQLDFVVVNAKDDIIASALAIDNIQVRTPEPGTDLLLGVGLVSLLVLYFKRSATYCS